MQFSTTALTAFLLSVGGATAFTQPSAAFVSTRTGYCAPVATFSGVHAAGCACAGCQSRSALFMSEAPTEEVPAEVEALDGVMSKEEQHNKERPARQSLKKKGPKGKPLSEFEVGSTVKGRVKTLASYGAFMDIGAETDGLLHISQLSVDFVADVNDVLEINKEYDVRITKIDEGKKQVALSLLSAAEEEEAAAAAQKPKQQNQNSQPARRDDGALKALQEKGWETEKFIEGTVVSVVDFGAFVKIDCSLLNSEVEGEMDGLVHISALSANRVNSVNDIVKVDQKVQVRVKSIDKGKVSLSMVSVEEEEAKNEARGPAPGQVEGAKDWKESLEKIQKDLPTFNNKPMVVDLRS